MNSSLRGGDSGIHSVFVIKLPRSLAYTAVNENPALPYLNTQFLAVAAVAPFSFSLPTTNAQAVSLPRIRVLINTL